MQIYTVQQGDSIWNIAQRYGADINQIILVNKLNNPNILAVGQSIIVPEQDREYVVQPGDNMWAIAQHYGVTVQELAAYNSISDPARVFPGEMLKMPYVIHTVQSGDTLWQIAQNYGTTIEQIVQANNLDRKSTRLNSSHVAISYAVFCLKKKK